MDTGAHTSQISKTTQTFFSILFAVVVSVPFAAYAAPEPTFTSTPVTSATQGVSYTYNIATDAGDGGGAITLSASTTLPSGLSLSDNGDGTGTLSGIPSVAGTPTVDLSAYNASSTLYGEQSFTLTIAAAPTLSITTTTLPDGTVGNAYDSSVVATSTDSADTLTWTLAGGSLPTGLSLNTATGAITGTTTTGGDYAFTIGVIGANAYSATTTQSLSIHVGLAQTITFGAIATHTYGDADFGISASSTSALVVSFSSTSTACSITDNNDGTATVHIAAAGSCAIAATQAGDATYSAAPEIDQTFTIDPISVSTSIVASNKVYDGTTDAAFATTTLAGIINSDDVYVSGGTGTFDTRNIGSGKLVTVTGLVLSGAQAANYSLTNTSATSTATVTVRAITVTAATTTKTYDATTTSATIPDITSGSLGSGDTGNFIQYFSTKDAASGKTLTPAGTVNDGNGGANYAITFATSTTGTINRATLTISAQVNTKEYDATTTAATSPSVSGLQGSDTVTNLAETYADALAGTGKRVSVSSATINDGLGGENYFLAFVSNFTSVITAKALSVSGLSASDKVYDGDTTATITGTPSLVGVIAGDDVSILGTPVGTFASKDVSASTTVSVSGLSLTGAQAGNYSLVSPTLSAAITAKALSITTASISDKTYDGTTVASTTAGTLSGFIGSETVAATPTGTFDTKNVGIGKTVTVDYVLVDGTNGGLASNYALASTTATASITTRALSVSASGSDKVYDADTSASVTFSDDRVGGDVLTASGTATFADANVGTGKPVTVTSISISGTDAGNYTLATTTTATTASITARPITITAQPNTKVYDATTTASTLPTITSGTLAGSDSATLSEMYDTKTIGTGKMLTPSVVISDGNSGANYNVTFVNDTTGIINQRAITVTAQSDSKTYDSTTAASTAPTITSGSLAGSDTSSFTQTYDTQHVGSNKTLTPSGSVSDGNSGANYSITFVPDTVGTITPASLTITAQTNTKTYDASTTASATPSVTGLLGSDSASNLSETYDTATAGSGKTLSVASYTINDGNSGGNYSVSTLDDTTGVINTQALTITASDFSKIYDASAFSGGNGVTYSGFVTGEDSSVLGGTLSYGGTSQGATGVGSYVIAPSGLTSPNYAITFVNGTLTVTQAALTVTADDQTKVYGNANPSLTASITGFVGGETLGTSDVTGSAVLSTSATTNSNVGSYAITAATGTLASTNYSFGTFTDGTLSITQRPITVTAQSNSKVYDGTTAASTAPIITSGTLAGSDTASFIETYDTKNVGTSKTLTPSGSVSDSNSGANYNVTFVNDTTGVITAPTLTVSGATASNKTYDGATTTTLSFGSASLVGVVSGDTVSLDTTSASGSFADKTVGTGKAITITGVALSGSDASNYILTQPSTTATITARSLTVTATGVNKTYDATTAGTVTLSDDKVSGDSVTDSYTSALFADQNVGTGKLLSVSGISISGNDASNYTLANTTAATSANITARSLFVSATTSDKTYDATNSATVALTTDALSADLANITTSGTGTFSDTNAGTGKTVTVSGISIGGSAASNYTLSNTSTTTTASISSAPLTITAQTNTKAYDGTTVATATPAVIGLQGSDTVTGLTQTYDTSAVGSGKTLSVSAYTVNDGNGGNNYTVSTVADVTGIIAKANQTITFGNLSAKHFGDADFAVSATSDSGLSVTFMASGACTVSGSTVHITGIGSCTITAQQAGDSSYNAAADVPHTFSITDNTAPVITLNGSATEYVAINNAYTDPGATATDDVDSSVTVVTGGSVDTSTAGTYTLTYNASDSSSNAATQKTRSVVVESATLPLTTTTSGSTVSATISSTLTASTTSNQITLSFTVPAGATLSSNTGWNGSLTLPAVSNSYTAPSFPNTSILAISSAIEVGAGNTAITADKGIRLVFSGQAGKLVGWSRSGAFSQITTVCSADSQVAGDALGVGGDCYINSSSDLVVWTKHLTTFMTYTITPKASTNGPIVGSLTPLSTPAIVTVSGGGSGSYLPATTTTATPSINAPETQLVALYTKLISTLSSIISLLRNK